MGGSVAGVAGRGRGIDVDFALVGHQESWRAASFQEGPKLSCVQKRTASVCCGERLVLFVPPSSFVSL